MPEIQNPTDTVSRDVWFRHPLSHRVIAWLLSALLLFWGRCWRIWHVALSHPSSQPLCTCLFVSCASMPVHLAHVSSIPQRTSCSLQNSIKDKREAFSLSSFRIPGIVIQYSRFLSPSQPRSRVAVTVIRNLPSLCPAPGTCEYGVESRGLLSLLFLRALSFRLFCPILGSWSPAAPVRET